MTSIRSFSPIIFAVIGFAVSLANATAYPSPGTIIMAGTSFAALVLSFWIKRRIDAIGQQNELAHHLYLLNDVRREKIYHANQYLERIAEGHPILTKDEARFEAELAEIKEIEAYVEKQTAYLQSKSILIKKP